MILRFVATRSVAFRVAGRIVLFVLCAVLSGCGGAEQDSAPKPRPVGKADLHGRWRLQTIGGNLPSQYNVKSMTIEFKSDGSWSYQGILINGQAARGSGTWSMRDSKLTYKTDKLNGQTVAKLYENELELETDPVIKPTSGKSTSRYAREK